jgi:DNA-binding transcriptional ArsR family regulator
MNFSDHSNNFKSSSSEDWVKVFDALSHPLRIKIIGLLSEKRQYVSELARMINISRPLLYMHLRKLESAKLIKGNLEISSDGKAMKYYEVQDFDFHLTPTALAEYSKYINFNKET